MVWVEPAMVAQPGQSNGSMGLAGGAHLVAGGGEPAGRVPIADQVAAPVLVDRPERGVRADDCGIARTAMIVSPMVVRDVRAPP